MRSRGVWPVSDRLTASRLVSICTSSNTVSAPAGGVFARTRTSSDVGSTGPPRQTRSPRSASGLLSGRMAPSLIGVGRLTMTPIAPLFSSTASSSTTLSAKFGSPRLWPDTSSLPLAGRAVGPAGGLTAAPAHGRSAAPTTKSSATPAAQPAARLTGRVTRTGLDHSTVFGRASSRIVGGTVAPRTSLENPLCGGPCRGGAPAVGMGHAAGGHRRLAGRARETCHRPIRRGGQGGHRGTRAVLVRASRRLGGRVDVPGVRAPPARVGPRSRLLRRRAGGPGDRSRFELGPGTQAVARSGPGPRARDAGESGRPRRGRDGLHRGASVDARRSATDRRHAARHGTGRARVLAVSRPPVAPREDPMGRRGDRLAEATSSSPDADHARAGGRAQHLGGRVRRRQGPDPAGGDPGRRLSAPRGPCYALRTAGALLSRSPGGQRARRPLTAQYRRRLPNSAPMRPRVSAPATVMATVRATLRPTGERRTSSSALGRDGVSAPAAAPDETAPRSFSSALGGFTASRYFRT